MVNHQKITALADHLSARTYTDSVFVRRPSHFGFNAETAISNVFQKDPGQDVSAIALKEFEGMITKLSSKQIHIDVLEEPAACRSPDSVFLNNWFNTTPDASLYIFPMLSDIRKTEVTEDLSQTIESLGFRISKFTDLRKLFTIGQILEGTGSMVIDNLNQLCFAALSNRTHKSAVEYYCQLNNLEPVTFETNSTPPVYHTNVLMNLAPGFAIICTDTIGPITESKRVLAKLEETGRNLIHITPDQMFCFAGNMITMVVNGTPLTIASESALKSLLTSQKRNIERFSEIVSVSIPTIEAVGGGGARCMIAENFLPKVYAVSNGFKVTSPITESDLQQYFRLRWEILREPWDQPEGTEFGEDEDKALHYMVLDEEERVMAVGRMHPINDETVQFRYMGVSEKMRGKGVGKLILSAMEKHAAKLGYKDVFLHARETAVPFYQKSGYSMLEKTYLLFESIQHYSMNKSI